MYSLIENRKIRVFLSSTFEDMKDEREYLIKNIFPELRNEAHKRNVSLIEVDLRWGISEEDSKNGKILDICFEEIDNSIPFFIGIIGNRYGWCPQEGDVNEGNCKHFNFISKYIHRKLSATEMEIQYGVLDRDEPIYASFFINKKLVDEKFIDYPDKLYKLKESIISNKRYPFSYYDSIEELGLHIKDFFIRLLDKLFPLDNQLTDIQLIELHQKLNANQLCSFYIPDNNRFIVIDSFIQEAHFKQLIISGESGVGKSAFVAEWARRNNDKYDIIYYSVGCGSNNCDTETLCRHLLSLVRLKYEIEDTTCNLNNTLKTIGENKLIIIIDGFDLVKLKDNETTLDWFPLPCGNIQFVITIADNVQYINDAVLSNSIRYLMKRTCSNLYRFNSLSVNTREEIISNLLKNHGKKIDKQMIKSILNNNLFKNTLALRMLLAEMIIHSNFKTLDQHINKYLSCIDITSFINTIIERYEEDYGSMLVRKTLTLIAISEEGFNESELRDLINEDLSFCDTPEFNTSVNHLHWSQFYCAFREYFNHNKGGGIGFNHKLLRETILEKYVYDNAQITHSLRLLIIKKFKDENSPRAYIELSKQYYTLNMHKELYALLTKPDVFYYLINYSWGSFSYMWVDLCVYSSEKYKLYNIIDTWKKLDDSQKELSHNKTEILLSSIIVEEQGCWPPITCPTEFAYIQELSIPFQKTIHDIFHYTYSAGAGYLHSPHKLSKSLELLLRAQEIIERSDVYEWGDDYHKNLKDCYSVIAQWYHINGDYKQELNYLEKAIIIIEKLDMHDRSDDYYKNLKEYYYRIAQCCHLNEYNKQELNYLEKAISPCIKYHGKYHVDTLFAYYIVGFYRSEQGDNISAINDLEQALSIAENLNNNDEIIKVCKGLLTCYIKAFQKAEQDQIDNFYNIDNYKKYLCYYEKMAFALKANGSIEESNAMINDINDMRKSIEE